MMLFVTHQAAANISRTTIKVYLLAIYYVHVIAGLHNSFNEQLTPRLQLIVRGIKKSQALTTQQKVRLPITLLIMQSIKRRLSNQPHSYSNIMLWAACCQAFFGFMSVSEFTIPCHTDYDPSLHLSFQDISVDNRDNPRILKVNIKQSKADPFRQGVQIYLGATDTPLCPILCMIPYLARRGTCAGPLFLTEHGQGLTRQYFALL